ncbi:transposable element Tcb1 transposase [Trichonephila clavipes]|nr:transposable element Tcb1 transposase [Trichonephila clavipes]
MQLRCHRRQYEQMPELERGIIIEMMEAGWSARTCAADEPTHQRLHFEWYCARRDWTVTEWNQVVFNEESKFNLRSDDNRVRVWRLRGECLNPAFALQRHTAPTAGGMVWVSIANDTWSSLIFIQGTMTAQRYVHNILQPHVLPFMVGLPETGQCSATHSKNVTRLPPSLYYPFLTCSIPRFGTNRAYLESFGTVSYEFGRTKGAFTATVEQEVSKHHAELVCPNTRSYCIVNSRLEGSNRILKFVFFLQ